MEEKTTRSNGNTDKPDFIDGNMVEVDFVNRRIAGKSGSKKFLTDKLGIAAATAIIAPVLIANSATPFLNPNNFEKQEGGKANETVLPKTPAIKSIHSLISGFGKKPWDSGYVDKIKDPEKAPYKSR